MSHHIASLHYLVRYKFSKITTIRIDTYAKTSSETSFY